MLGKKKIFFFFWNISSVASKSYLPCSGVQEQLTPQIDWGEVFLTLILSYRELAKPISWRSFWWPDTETAGLLSPNGDKQIIIQSRLIKCPSLLCDSACLWTHLAPWRWHQSTKGNWRGLQESGVQAELPERSEYLWRPVHTHSVESKPKNKQS